MRFGRIYSQPDGTDMDIWVILNPLIRALVYGACLVVTGTLLFGFHFKKYQTRQSSAYCLSLAKNGSVFGLVISAIFFLSISGNMGGDFSSIFSPLFLNLALQTKSAIAAALLLLGFSSFYLSGKLSWPQSEKAFAIGGAILLLSSFVTTGHALKTGPISQILLFVHLVGISFWIGSLLPLLHLSLSNNTANLHLIAHRFGILAVYYVLGLLVAGAGFTYALLGSDLSLLLSTSYGNVLLAKMATVSTLLLFGALNKFWCVPKIIKDGPRGARLLRISVQFELLLAVIILSMTALLSTSLTLPMGG